MENLPNTVSKTIDVLATKFGATGSQLWWMYVHYVQFYALAWMLIGSGAFGMVALVSSKMLVVKGKDDYGNDDEGFRIVRCIVYGCCAIAIALFVASNVTDVILPQGAAIAHLTGH